MKYKKELRLALYYTAIGGIAAILLGVVSDALLFNNLSSGEIFLLFIVGSILADIVLLTMKVRW